MVFRYSVYRSDVKITVTYEGEECKFKNLNDSEAKGFVILRLLIDQVKDTLCTGKCNDDGVKLL